MDNTTKNDLDNLRLQLCFDMSDSLDKKLKKYNQKVGFEWLRSKVVRNSLNISAATLQNLRMSGKIRFKKIIGSYYYIKIDFEILFKMMKSSGYQKKNRNIA